MKALLKTAHGVSIGDVPDPILRSPHDVLIRIAVSGLCRTDIYVADGLIRCKNPLVLGHEFSGVVEQIGRSVQGVHPGDRVTSSPDSRDLLGGRRDNRSLVWIERVQVDFRQQCTRLKLVRQRMC